MTYKYLLLTLFLSAFLTACGGSSSSSSDPVDEPNGDTPDPGDDDDDNDDDDTANGDDDEATAAGLVAHFMFEENLEDAAGNFGEGQITGDAPETEGGSITYAAGALDGSTAAVFDGTSGVYLGEGLIGPGDYTLSIWLHPDQLNQFTSTFYGETGPNSWVSLTPVGTDEADQNTMLWAGDADGTGWFDGNINSQIPSGDWSHLVFTYSSGELATYLNGELEFEHTGFPNVFSTDSATFHLGVNNFDPPYTGLIDDLRIYDVALTAEQVAALNAGEEVIIDEDQISDDEDDDANGDDDDANGDDDDGANGDDDGANGDGDDDDANGDDDDGANGDDDDAIAAIAGLSAHYAFEDSLEDSAGNFDSGSVIGDRPNADDSGSITYDGNGIGGGMALALDGSSGVRLPDGLINGTAMSLSMWVNPSEITDWTAAFFGDRMDGRWFAVIPKWGFDDAATVRAHFEGNERDWWDVPSDTPITSLNTNEWTHLSVTLEGAELRFYINGDLVGSATDFLAVFEGADDAQFSLGVNWSDPAFQGLMDQLRIYDRALSAEEITTLAAEND